MDINPINPANLAAQAAGTAGAATGDASVSFKSLLADALQQVNTMQQSADAQTVKLAAGEPVAIDEVMLAVQKADLALQLTQQIRNKLVEAYQDVARMQI
jgi:flagellar hook-basal body complex protein FliE